MEDDLPPSYGSLFNEHKSGISYIDFLPYGTKGGLFSKPECDRFGTVVDSANEWLRQNPQWEIRTCESVEFKDKQGDVIPSKMSYYENTRYQMSFIRGLRLWLKISPSGQERVKKIGYVNLVPETVSSDNVFAHAKYETLDNVLLKFNNASRTSPLPGRIITIETQGMKIKSSGLIDPDRSRWTEYGGYNNRFVYVIRIFYEVGDPLYEEIGATDFVPEMISSGCLGAYPKYDYFSTLFKNASQWCSNQSDLKICNMQSLATKVHYGFVDPRKMSYTEHEGHHTSFVRTLRVAHIRKQPSDCTSRTHFGVKTFVPVQLQGGFMHATFETLQETMQRVSNSIQEYGAEVLNMETSVVRLSPKGPIHSSEKTFYYDRGKRECYFFVIRAYLKGS